MTALGFGVGFQLLKSAPTPHPPSMINQEMPNSRQTNDSPCWASQGLHHKDAGSRIVCKSLVYNSFDRSEKRSRSAGQQAEEVQPTGKESKERCTRHTTPPCPFKGNHMRFYLCLYLRPISLQFRYLTGSLSTSVAGFIANGSDFGQENSLISVYNKTRESREYYSM